MRSKKGYALVLSIILVIMLTIIGFGLYTSIEHSVKEIKLREIEYIKGHYAALAGQRYALILLQDPVGLFGYDPEPEDSVEVSLWDDYNDFATDIGLSSRQDVTLVITKINESEFDVSATYSIE
ncbi:MAG: hypothetical protein JSV93_03500 [Candidatus Omnitrophota bacterium]|nr:MAG: hypothetical protein JSV93_03500 [Candidatus Omnitrophota bacterium]